MATGHGRRGMPRSGTMTWIIGVSLGLAGSAHAQTAWLDAGADWNTPGNWSAGVPTATTTAVLPPDAAIGFTPTLSAAGEALGLTLDNSGGGVYAIAGAGQTLTLGTGGLTLTGGGSSVVDPNVVVAANQTFAVDTGGTVTLNGALAGSYRVTKDGAGTLALSNLTNPYTGGFTVNGGSLTVVSSGSIPTAALRANALDLGASGTYSYSGIAAENRLGELSGSGTLNIGTNAALQTVLADATYSGTATSSGVWTVRGLGTQTLTAATGMTGVLAVHGSGLAGATGGGLTLAGTATVGTGTTGTNIRGGVLTLDNTGTDSTNRLVGSGIVSFLGGGTLQYLGNSAGSTETAGQSQFQSGSQTVRVVNSTGGTGATLTFNDSGSLRDSTSMTVNFIGQGGTLGASGDNPRISYTGVLFTNTTPGNGMLANSSGLTVATIGWARVNTTSWAGANGSNSIIALADTVRNSGNLSTAGANELTDFQPSATTTTLTASLGVAALKINPTATGQSLVLNTGSVLLNTNALMLAGSTDFAITGGGLGSFGSGATRYVYVTDPAATLSFAGTLTGAAQPVNKSGPGVLSLNGSANQMAFGTLTNINILEGVLRASLTSLGGGSSSGGAQTNLNLRGGVLEISGGGSLSRVLDIAGTALGGSITFDTSATNNRGSGGFSAIGGAASVTLVTTVGGATPSAPFWNDNLWVADGFALLLGSTKADSAITVTNNFGLDNGTAGAYNAREIRVFDNTGSTSDVAILSGIVGGSASSDLLKTGAGTLRLTADNTQSFVSTSTGTPTIAGFNGGVIVAEGALELGHNNALGNALYVLVGNRGGSANASLLTADNGGAGAFSVSRPITVGSGTTGTVTLGTMDTAGTSTWTGAVTALQTVTVSAAAGGAADFSGVISGPGGLIKAGAGTVFLSAADTYAGTTTVTAGALLINSTGSLGAGGGLVTVSGGTLGGEGTLSRAITVNGGVLDPGLDPGTGTGILTAGGTVTFASGTGAFTVQLNGLTAGSGYDQLLISGTNNVSLGGSLSVTFGGSGWATPNQYLYIINNPGAGTLGGTFSNYANGDVVASFGGYDWYIYYNASSLGDLLTGGNDVVVTNFVVPEPGTLALLALGLPLLRRRRST